MTEPVFQRRRWERVSVQYSVLVRKHGESTLGRLGHVKTLGLGGCLVSLDREFKIADILKLRLILKGHSAEITARVAYCVEKAPGEYHAGVEFLDLAPSDWAAIQKAIDQDRGAPPPAGRPGS